MEKKDILTKFGSAILGNVGIRKWLVGPRTKATQWTIADSLGLIPKDDPETCYHNFDLLRRGWFPRFCTPRGVIWRGTWRTLHRRLISHAPSAISISIHGGILPGELRTRALWSGAEYSSDLPTAGHKKMEKVDILGKFVAILLNRQMILVACECKYRRN